MPSGTVNVYLKAANKEILRPATSSALLPSSYKPLFERITKPSKSRRYVAFDLCQWPSFNLLYSLLRDIDGRLYCPYP